MQCTVQTSTYCQRRNHATFDQHVTWQRRGERPGVAETGGENIQPGKRPGGTSGGIGPGGNVLHPAVVNGYIENAGPICVSAIAASL